MSWKYAVAVAVTGLLLPMGAWGADLNLALRGNVEFDNNINRTSVGEEGDVVFRLIPRVELKEDDGKFRWDVAYQMPWVKAIEQTRVDGINHFAYLGGRYFFNDRTQVFGRNNFQYSNSVRSVTAIDSDTQTPTINNFQEPVIRNRMVLGTQHAFTPRLSGNAAFTWRAFDTDLPNRANNMVYAGNLNTVYALNPRHQVGAGVAGTFQDFDASNNGARAPLQTYFINFFGTWAWFIDEFTTFEITFGPTFVDTEQDVPPVAVAGQPVIPFIGNTTDPEVFVNDHDSCGTAGLSALQVGAGLRTIPAGGACGVRSTDSGPVVGAGLTDYAFLSAPVGASSTDWTLFGEMSLSRRWTPNLVSSLSYRRTDSTASGIAGSATLDVVSFLNTWKFAEFWMWDVRADFTQRESTSPLAENLIVVQATPLVDSLGNPFNGAAATGGLVQSVLSTSIDTTRWGVSTRLARNITRHLQLSVRYIYNNQTSKQGSAGSRTDFDNHIITLGAQYQYDIFNLW